MQSFVKTEPHASTAALLDHLCDEATFVDWEQTSAQLPDCRPAGVTCRRRLFRHTD
jgi:hypothetical protein